MTDSWQAAKPKTTQSKNIIGMSRKKYLEVVQLVNAAFQKPEAISESTKFIAKTMICVSAIQTSDPDYDFRQIRDEDLDKMKAALEKQLSGRNETQKNHSIDSSKMMMQAIKMDKSAQTSLALGVIANSKMTGSLSSEIRSQASAAMKEPIDVEIIKAQLSESIEQVRNFIGGMK